MKTLEPLMMLIAFGLLVILLALSFDRALDIEFPAPPVQKITKHSTK